MSLEYYYTPEKPNSPVWVLEIDKDASQYALSIRTEPTSIHRFLAMPTFLNVLAQCAGYKHVNVDHEA